MAVIFDPDGSVFTIHTDHTTYQMQADRLGHLLHLYYGRRSSGRMDYLLTYADRGFSPNPYEAGMDRTYSLDVLPQEFPVQGSGDFRSPLLSVRNEEGAWGCHFRYSGYEIREGKYALPGLPASYSADPEDDAGTLVIYLRDTGLKLELALYYGVFPHRDVITRAAVLTNRGETPVTVEKFQTACLDFTSGDFDLITFHGRHMMERCPDRRPVGHGAETVGSRRGMSSHQYNPFVILADRETTETAGRCFAMQFVYSGGFLAEAERDQFEQTRLQMGLAEEKFSFPLLPGESLTAPEVLLSFSPAGLETLSHQLHGFLRKHICRGKYRDTARPVLLNSWEACTCDFTEKTILTLADQAEELGMDMLVLDDGWYGNRSDDNRALGDWTANTEKLGGTLGELIRKVNSRGLKFGIWMEPEMVSEDSCLYRAHPDWALALPGEAPVRSRNQLVLDLSRKEVREFVYESVCSVLSQGNIEYLKWDFNRSISDVYSRTADSQGRVLYDYMLGLYDVLERLTKRWPELLIEGCAGGGGRFDAGMLYYTPQIWCSDNTDAMDRLVIQYGTSFGYPACTMAAHVSACPNQGTGNTVSLKTRGASVMGGIPGYELNPAALSKEEKETVREQVRSFRKYAPLILNGTYYRLTNPLKDPCCAFEYVSEDGKEALIVAVLREKHGNMPPVYVVPRGLKPGTLYRDRSSGRIYPADALMDAGIPLPGGLKACESVVLDMEQVSDGC